ncbi:MAG: aspartate-semialdehyde dehydrogenase [archaeon]
MFTVGILGATGTVGQRFIYRLNEHPFLRIAYLAASPNSAGKTYEEAVGNRWKMDMDIPPYIKKMIVGDAGKIGDALANSRHLDMVFSAIEGPKERAKEFIQEKEIEYAAAGIPVVSNNSAHRWTSDIPMIIPEINLDHLKMIDVQKKNRGWKRGFIVTKPNCSLQSWITPVYALMQKGYWPSELDIVTQQALSGAGYPGVPSWDLMANVIPLIDGEEDKTEREPGKILGRFTGEEIKLNDYMDIEATCTRVPVVNGHLATVKMRFPGQGPELEEIIDIWKNFKGLPQTMGLPSAPNPAIIYRSEPDRPQPRIDCNAGNGMAVSVGRLRKMKRSGKYRFAGLSHNTDRGAAGGAILIAEYLALERYLTG